MKSLILSFVLVSACFGKVSAEEIPFRYARPDFDITQLMVQKSSDVAHIRILAHPSRKEPDLDLVIESQMVHPVFYCEVISSLKGELKEKDRFQFIRSSDPEIPKDKRLFKPGEEFIVFLIKKPISEGSPVIALTLIDNWCGVAPYDATLKDLIIYWRKR